MERADFNLKVQWGKHTLANTTRGGKFRRRSDGVLKVEGRKEPQPVYECETPGTTLLIFWNRKEEQGDKMFETYQGVIGERRVL